MLTLLYQVWGCYGIVFDIDTTYPFFACLCQTFQFSAVCLLWDCMESGLYQFVNTMHCLLIIAVDFLFIHHLHVVITFVLIRLFITSFGSASLVPFCPSVLWCHFLAAQYLDCTFWLVLSTLFIGFIHFLSFLFCSFFSNSWGGKSIFVLFWCKLM